MCILDCLILVSVTIFYTNKAKIWMGVVTSLQNCFKVCQCCHWSPCVHGLITGIVPGIATNTTTGVIIDYIVHLWCNIFKLKQGIQPSCTLCWLRVCSVRVWDVIILCPNAIFLFYLVIKMRAAVLKLHRTSSPVLTTFFLLVSILWVLWFLLCI